ncbi:Sec-independent protein translocase TatA [Marinicauda salina]|uniref:Sec-independent protein translocase protein TatA n=1 Tax=Marinicauda salina TaxID=2135793 RepID=A0A2U2BT48_9PROT|nr:twin-arginine translocase TatA/TatE family subunit [Marinicauda salina]PWE17146.1 Sec-independent protein translocase TatA [Marinicauda salina]
MGPHWTGLIIVAVLLLLLFGGRGKISALMGDFAKGITAFRKGLKDDDAEDGGDEETPRTLRSDESAGAETRREDERAGS